MPTNPKCNRGKKHPVNGVQYQEAVKKERDTIIRIANNKNKLLISDCRVRVKPVQSRLEGCLSIRSCRFRLKRNFGILTSDKNRASEFARTCFCLTR